MESNGKASLKLTPFDAANERCESYAAAHKRELATAAQLYSKPVQHLKQAVLYLA